MKSNLSVSLDSGIIAKIGKSKFGASALVTKALNQFFHLDDENLDDLSDEELGEEYEKANLRAAALNSIGLERKAARDAETTEQMAEQRQAVEEQNARIALREAERKEKEARA